ncbi:glycoside hydrolase family 5 protein [Sphingomonas sp. LB-2]|uniref:glycoside hydrolase family 5 protein n=1 Tax=Sphingomonas caeni TaxID=2984949 RepID=UPI002231564B|nr:glycoside hydrolase family 5 protein [Sphingomonas caeni]MCW3846159.1 glycoside hydrolase family 5 protein [Sphingomonas caeni]
MGPRILAGLALAGLVCASAAQAAGPFTPAPAAVPAKGATLRLGKCVNISNMLEAPQEGQWGRGFRDSDIVNLKSKGFTGIRLPARFSTHARLTAPYAIDPAFMKRVRHITDLATANGMSVIVDMHHYEELFTDPAGHTARLAGMWRQIGVAFKDAPATVYFELINEPHDRFDGSNLWAVQGPALAAVRESNPTRPVVIDGPGWASLDGMITTSFPDDPYIVPTFHWYDPANFGFDKAPWMNPPVRETWGNAADIAELRGVLGKVQAWMKRTGRVPFVGELGANEARAVAQRANFYSVNTAAFASIGVQSCAWGYTNTHQLYRDGSGWEPGIADGMMTTTTLPE